jgi:hypothetical protein
MLLSVSPKVDCPILMARVQQRDEVVVEVVGIEPVVDGEGGKFP